MLSSHYIPIHAKIHAQARTRGIKILRNVGLTGYKRVSETIKRNLFPSDKIEKLSTINLQSQRLY